MRRRREAIDALTENEYIQIFDSQDRSNGEEGLEKIKESKNENEDDESPEENFTIYSRLKSRKMKIISEKNKENNNDNLNPKKNLKIDNVLNSLDFKLNDEECDNGNKNEENEENDYDELSPKKKAKDSSNHHTVNTEEDDGDEEFVLNENDDNDDDEENNGEEDNLNIQKKDEKEEDKQVNEEDDDDDENEREDYYLRRRKRFSKAFLAKNFNDDDEDEDNQLGKSSGYKMEENPLTQKQMEEEEEKSLENDINNINININLTQQQIITSPKIDGVVLNKKQISNDVVKNYHFSPQIKFRSTNSLMKAQNNFDILKFYSQNIIYYDYKVKLILIGKSKVGKSLFMNKVIDPNYHMLDYQHTLALDIKKAYYELNNLSILMEIFDTNNYIIENNIIKTYYEICNGCIFLTDNIVKDFDFIKINVEKIYSICPEPNILIFVNDYKHTNENELINNNGDIKDFLTTHYINYVIICDLTLFNKNKDSIFKEYLNQIIKKKPHCFDSPKLCNDMKFCKNDKNSDKTIKTNLINSAKITYKTSNTLVEPFELDPLSKDENVISKNRMLNKRTSGKSICKDLFVNFDLNN